MKTIFLHLFVACLFLAASLTVSADNGAFMPADDTAGASAVTFNLLDFGAVGDGVADDGPALQRALDALADAGGGTLYVPAGRYVIATPVMRSFSDRNSLTIRGGEANPPRSGWGLGLSSEFVVKVGMAADALTLKTLGDLVLENLNFTGVPGVRNDAKVVLYLSQIKRVLMQTCEFYGLSTQVAGGAIVYNYGCNLKIKDSAFLGCTTNHTLRTSVVHNILWRAISVTNTNFVDYGERRGFFSKTPYQSPFAWVGVGNAAPEGSTAQRIITLQDVFFDEGAISGINVSPEILRGPSHTVTPIELLYISRLYQNISQVGAYSWGSTINNVKRLFIEDSRYVWSRNGAGAIRLSKIDNAIIDFVRCTAPLATANKITADRSVKKLTIIDSIYEILKSDAGITKVINSATPEDDPARFVRQKYIRAKGIEPSPIEHFYWTDLMLQCNGNSSCLLAKRTALSKYLAGPLPQTYTIRGQVKNRLGQGIAGVAVWLTGSKMRTAQTDDAGNYVFADLPIRGHYTVTPVKAHYSFETLNKTFITLIADQVANFIRGTERTDPTLTSLEVHPAAVGGNPAEGKITLSAPAFSTGMVVSVSDTNPAATTPLRVKVPAGATYATFPITTSPVASITSGIVTARLGAVSRSASINVLPVGIKRVTLSPTQVVGPGRVTGTLTLDNATALGDITVTLESGNPLVAHPTVNTLTIPAGQVTMDFSVVTTDVSNVSYAIIKAKANGVTRSVQLIVKPQ
jgi:Pectate lyase superfamily protein/Carboxypeptidase regulatory-like domain